MCVCVCVCVGGFVRVCRCVCVVLTCELPGEADLSLVGVYVRVDGEPTVVAHPVGLAHPLLQGLDHVLLGHVQDPQVGETGRSDTDLQLALALLT